MTHSGPLTNVQSLLDARLAQHAQPQQGVDGNVNGTRAEAGSCDLGGRWLLAVGSSPLRIFFSALASRLLEGATRVPPSCMPSFGFLHHGACQQVDTKERPCVVDIQVAALGARLTFIWDTGEAMEASRTALVEVLRDASRRPDLVLMESGAWQWSQSTVQRSQSASHFLRQVLSVVRHRPGRHSRGNSSSDGTRSAVDASDEATVVPCVWLGIPWSPWEDERFGVHDYLPHKWQIRLMEKNRTFPPPLGVNLSLHEFEWRMRTKAMRGGCAFLESNRCLSRYL